MCRNLLIATKTLYFSLSAGTGELASGSETGGAEKLT
jgi:hypothetical protein